MSNLILKDGKYHLNFEIGDLERLINVNEELIKLRMLDDDNLNGIDVDVLDIFIENTYPTAGIVLEELRAAEGKGK